ncbi:DUF4332 domain-containing protein [Syntrophomonas curvata]
MSYYIDASKVRLDDLLIRITESDLVPSRSMLLEDIKENFSKLKMNGVLTLADFRKAVKNSKNIGPFAEKTEISVDYLTLLRREVESYFPKAFPVSAFVWLGRSQITKLEANGYKNTVLLYEALELPSKREELIKSIGLEKDFADKIFTLAGLTRIQWVNPVFAKVLVDAGYWNAKSIAEADPKDLHEAVARINEEGQYFKGKIGLRDMKRLVKAAAYVNW